MPSAGRLHTAVALSALGCLVFAVPARPNNDAPQWMHALVSVPLPDHDEKTNAIQLYSETVVTVQSVDKVKTVVREAFKILRPEGRAYGQLWIGFNPRKKINNLHGWTIPAQGKDFEVRDKEAIDMSLHGVEYSEFVSDAKERFVRIPAAEPGNIVGYEYETEEQPLFLQAVWEFQKTEPVREARYVLQLPAGWEIKATWLNHPEVLATQPGTNQWQWVVANVPALRLEQHMPPWDGVAGGMVISYFPPGSPPTKTFADWAQMGTWYSSLTQGRRDASPEIKQKTAELTGSLNSNLAKMRAIARFVQQQVRYVAISLGIGGVQPHPASDVFRNRYGDCKDKATLMSSMLQQNGIDSYYVVINSERGSVSPSTPAFIGAFDHVVLAIRLPGDVKDASLAATMSHPDLGAILFFDPTNPFIPFGEIGGYLQGNYGLLVTPKRGELVRLPQLPSSISGVRRTGSLTLDAAGTLRGDFSETHTGDDAWGQREFLKNVTSDKDKVRPVEKLLAGSLTTYAIDKASFTNLDQTDQPFGYQYSIVARNYGRIAGNLLLVRPRVLGVEARAILESKEPRRFPVEFEGPRLDSDTFEIKLPPGYEVDDLPPSVDVDYGFANYHSKTEAKGDALRYSRTFEVKDVSVPLAKMEDLKKLYRMIASDERNTAVLKPHGQ